MPLLDESQIKAAILHPEPEVRERAVRYFGTRRDTHADVVPVIIEAVERYGPADTWVLLLAARGIMRTAQALDWIIERLAAPLNLEDEAEGNLHDALSKLVVAAEPGLLAERYDRILALPDIPESKLEELEDRVALHHVTWQTCWSKLVAFGQMVMEGDDELTIGQAQQYGRLVDALVAKGRGRPEHEDFVMNLVRRQFPKNMRPIYETIEPQILELAGYMQLTQAIPLILRRLLETQDDDEEIWLGNSAITALKQFHSDAVARPIAVQWWNVDINGRAAMADVLGTVRTELAAERCLAFLKREKADYLIQALAAATLSQFNTDAIESVVELVADDHIVEPDREWRDLRMTLVEVATIMQVRFEQYDRWYEQARDAAWGWRNERIRYRTVYKEIIDDEDPVDAVDALDDWDDSDMDDIEDLIWQLKVTLVGIDPPIWRRIQVPDCTLEELHALLQIAFGWEFVHPYTFLSGDTEFAAPRMVDDDGSGPDARDTMLSDVIPNVADQLIYLYDFGDNWKHRIEVEQVSPTDDPVVPPVCLDGARACPPEDIGGVPGFAQLLAAIADPQNPEHSDMVEWVGHFDPDAFDRDAVNEELREELK